MGEDVLEYREGGTATKQKTGKKIGKILLLVILAAVVGVIVYTALTWPVYPDRQKPAESYQQMKQTAEDLGVLAPPEDVLPWTQPEYDFWLDNTRFPHLKILAMYECLRLLA